MQKFERFIIYPLLIVALFYAIAGGAGTETLANPFDSSIEDVIRTRRVMIYNDDDEMVGVFGRADINSGGALTIFNSSGNVISTISQNENKDGMINVFNRDGQRINAIMTSTDGSAGGIMVFNDKEERLVYIGPDTNGHGLINIHDKYGEDFRSYRFR